jgi:hypothetical protein
LKTNKFKIFKSLFIETQNILFLNFKATLTYLVLIVFFVILCFTINSFWETFDKLRIIETVLKIFTPMAGLILGIALLLISKKINLLDKNEKTDYFYKIKKIDSHLKIIITTFIPLIGVATLIIGMRLNYLAEPRKIFNVREIKSLLQESSRGDIDPRIQISFEPESDREAKFYAKDIRDLFYNSSWFTIPSISDDPQAWSDSSSFQGIRFIVYSGYSVSDTGYNAEFRKRRSAVIKTLELLGESWDTFPNPSITNLVGELRVGPKSSKYPITKK